MNFECFNETFSYEFLLSQIFSWPTTIDERAFDDGPSSVWIEDDDLQVTVFWAVWKEDFSANFCLSFYTISNVDQQDDKHHSVGQHMENNAKPLAKWRLSVSDEWSWFGHLLA